MKVLIVSWAAVTVPEISYTHVHSLFFALSNTVWNVSSFWDLNNSTAPLDYLVTQNNYIHMFNLTLERSKTVPKTLLYLGPCYKQYR